MKGLGKASRGGPNSRGKNIHKGLGLTRHAKEQGTTACDLGQVLRTCTAQIAELRKMGQWGQALQIFRAIQQHCIETDVIMYSAMISAMEISED